MNLDPRTTELPGYDFGAPSVPASPVSMEELAELQQLLRFGEQDVRHLKRVGEVLNRRLEEFDAALMEWIGPVAMTSVIRESDGSVDERYLERTHARFLRGFIDMCVRPYDQAWLDYQHEIGLRHHRAKKNQTDGAPGVAPYIPFRWIIASLYPTSQLIRPFLDDAAADEMLQAWTKALTLQITLYSRAYVPADDW
jgi:hypothetical protein